MAVVKILKSKSSFGAVGYNDSRCKNGEAVLMAARNFNLPDGTISYEQYLEIWSARNKRIKNPQFHAVISLKDNTMTKDELLVLGEEWLKRMGYGDNPYLVYYHTNTEHPHIHIVTSRVGKTGEKIDHNYEKERAIKHLNSILGVEQSSHNRKTISDLLHFSFSTKFQFLELCKTAGFTARLSEEGVECKKGDSVVKISNELLDFCIQRYHRDVDLKEKKKIQGLIYKYAELLSKERFVEFMKEKFGLKFIFYGKKGDINGYTIVDYKNKSVYKGSEIFGLKKLSELLDKPESPIIEVQMAIMDLLESNSYITTQQVNKKLDDFRIVNDNLIYLRTGKLFELDKSILNKLRYNDRLAHYLSKFTPCDNASIRAFAKLCFLKESDIRSVSPVGQLDHQLLMSYKEILNAVLEGNVSLGKALEERNLSIYFDQNNFYILDIANKVMVSNEILEMEYSLIKEKAEQENEEEVTTYPDNEPMESFGYVNIPTLDLAGLIYVVQAVGSRNKKKRKGQN